jgi:uncharacterized OB-fold protein
MPDPYEPVPTTDTLPYWEGNKEGKLRIQRCTACGGHYFYPRPFCPVCTSDQVEWTDTRGTATLHSYVINMRPLPGAEGYSPVIALVRLSEGPILLTNIVGVEPTPERLVLDMPLEVAFEARGAATVPVFRPQES